ncbi:hypothetical protein ACFW81_15490 [Streptomyces angustmyceticus]|uniref:hypothetical protein n=1 Tax=Streptomyces angustmyceticus TaxID=285578 RepID=UPI0036959121
MTEHPGLHRTHDRRALPGTAPPGAPHRRSLATAVRASVALMLAVAAVLAGVGAFTGIARASSAIATPARAWTAPSTAPADAHRTVARQQPAPDPATVVQTYFQAVNDRDFVSAWALGGRQHIAGTSYDAFVATFNTVSKYDVTIESVQGNKVTVQLDASLTNRTHRHYAGTYTVEDGVIVAADIRPT